MPVGNAGSGTARLTFSVEPIQRAPEVEPGTECRAPGPAWPQAEAALQASVSDTFPGRTVVYELAGEDTFVLWAEHAGAKPFPRAAGTVKATLKVSKVAGYLFVADGGYAFVYCIEVATHGSDVQLVPKLAATADES